MKKHTILVVDDDKTNLISARSILGEEYQLDLANSGTQALRFVDRKIYDLVLLDVMMPQMDGIETYRRMRGLTNGRNVPVIFLTGDQSVSTEVQCLKLGAADFITKPIVAEVMKSRIKRIIELQELRTNLEDRLREVAESLKTSIDERQKIAIEMDLATKIQQDALPDAFPPFTDRAEFDISSYMKAAKEVGGDFYDYFMLDEDHLCAVIADVSGKGIPGSIFMMTCKTRLRDYACHSKSPAEIMSDVNNLLCENNKSDMFVTVWMGILEISTGILTAVNAGHEYPIIRRPGGEFELIHDQHFVAMGMFENVEYTEHTYRLEPGTMIYLYTNGVTQATNAGYELFGTDRMLEALNNAYVNDVNNATDSVQLAVNQFVNEAPQFDDITMLCIRYNG